MRGYEFILIRFECGFRPSLRTPSWLPELAGKCPAASCLLLSLHLLFSGGISPSLPLTRLLPSAIPKFPLFLSSIPAFCLHGPWSSLLGDGCYYSQLLSRASLVASLLSLLISPVAANGFQHAPLQHLSQTPQFQRHFSSADTCRLQRAFGSSPQTASSQPSGNRR
jgi:hypothetical protein